MKYSKLTNLAVPFIGHNPRPKALDAAVGAIDRRGNDAVISVAEP